MTPTSSPILVDVVLHQITKPWLFLIAAFLMMGVNGDGDKEGRRGNALYNQELYEGAADAYRDGLATYQDETTDRVFYGLQNNLGAALYKTGSYETAKGAFDQAMAAAESDLDYARSAYNAGNNAFRAEDLEASLEHYKKALLAEPGNADAKFNYEFVKRQQEQQQEQQQQQEGEDENQDQQEQEQDQNNEQNQDQQQQDQQDQQQQNQDQQQQNEQEQEQQQQPEPQENQEQLSRQQAERILQALENEEEELLREVQKVKGRPRRVEKDW